MEGCWARLILFLIMVALVQLLTWIGGVLATWIGKVITPDVWKIRRC